ncbi:MAG: hypothetical protein R3C53_18025 [Pirellulaceae bacterium]
MSFKQNPFNQLFHCLCILCTLSATLFAQREEPTFEELSSPLITGGKLTRSTEAVRIAVESPGEKGQIHIPRFAAPLQSVAWLGDSSGEPAPTVTPEQEHWIVKWTSQPANSTTIELKFDAKPALIDETIPVEAVGDGSILLPAHLARTQGEKVRYEPQSFKNTVGYWTGKQDQATWQFQVAGPAKFNVGILQGCGKGHGGSSARFEFSRIGLNGQPQKVSELDFEVLETGHFQNFQWRHVGTIQIEQGGQYSLRLAPIHIAKAALMDIRAIHLVKLPE